jgi:hypothetical protein
MVDYTQPAEGLGENPALAVALRGLDGGLIAVNSLRYAAAALVRAGIT